jgi:hypothetical protein
MRDYDLDDMAGKLRADPIPRWRVRCYECRREAVTHTAYSNATAASALRGVGWRVRKRVTRYRGGRARLHGQWFCPKCAPAAKNESLPASDPKGPRR